MSGLRQPSFGTPPHAEPQGAHVRASLGQPSGRNSGWIRVDLVWTSSCLPLASLVPPEGADEPAALWAPSMCESTRRALGSLRDVPEHVPLWPGLASSKTPEPLELGLRTSGQTAGDLVSGQSGITSVGQSVQRRGMETCLRMNRTAAARTRACPRKSWTSGDHRIAAKAAG